MDAVLLDTTVASLLHPKRKGSPLRNKYEPHMKGKTLVLSFQSVAELFAWASENRWTLKERRKLERFLSKFLLVSYDMELAKVWAEVMAHCKKRGRRLEAGDAWIVATAVHHKLPLVTHDTDHLGLAIAGLEIISHAGSTAGQS